MMRWDERVEPARRHGSLRVIPELRYWIALDSEWGHRITEYSENTYGLSSGGEDSEPLFPSLEHAKAAAAAYERDNPRPPECPECGHRLEGYARIEEE